MKRLYGILLLGAILTTGFASNALALTAACSTISNQATLTYSDGGGPLTIDSDGDAITPGIQTTDFTVDSKVDLTISTFNSPVTATGINQVLVYRITNAGNDTQRYMLQLYAGNGEVRGAATDNFDMANIRVVVDTSPDGAVSVDALGVVTLGAGESVIDLTALADGSDLGLTPDVVGNVGVAPANVIEVYVIANVPAGQTTGDDAIYTLKARTYQVATVTGVGGVLGGETGNTSTTTTVNSCGNAVVLADVTAATNGVGAVADASKDGDNYATGYYTVSAATISVAKSQKIWWDPMNGAFPNAQAIPGAYVQYVITVSNTGAAAAILDTITDILQGDLAIDPDLIDGTSVTTTPGAPENGVDDGFKVVVTGSTRALDAANQYFTTSTADGVDFAGSTVTADFGTILPIEAGPGYVAGELKAGETVTLTFNAIIL